MAGPDGSTALLGAAITAMAAIAVAAIGAWATRTMRRQTVPDPDDELMRVLVLDLRSDNARLRTDLDASRAENARLRRALNRKGSSR